MERRLLVASGGGGDAIAAAMLGRELFGQADLHIATYSWDRLIVDPLPGPRRHSDFVGLEPVGEWNYRVTPTTTVAPPAASTLPRLAEELDASLYLLDPYHGAVGLERQLRELVELLAVDVVDVVDVGGDVVAEGSEPGLRSPLGDSLTLAAAHGLGVKRDVLVAGPGLDGELTEAQVLDRCASVGDTESAATLSASVAAKFGGLFEWHLSEASGLFCLGALGVRGTVEIRDRGTPVALLSSSACVWRLPLRAVVSINRVAQAMLGSTSLAEAETAVRQATGRPSELEYERAKAARLAAWSDAADVAAIITRELSDIEAAVARRARDFVTLRRLAELLHLPSQRLPALRAELRAHNPGAYMPPLWAVRREAEMLIREAQPRQVPLP